LTQQNLEWFRFHRSILPIEDSPELAHFLAFSATWPECTAECSIKFDGEAIHPARLNLLSTQTTGHQARYPAIEGLIKDLNSIGKFAIDTKLLRRFCDGWFRWKRVVSLFCGVDLRPNPAQSRLKVWFGLNRWAEGIERALELGEIDPGLRSLVRDRLLVGVDLRFDGHSAIKCYPDFRAEEIKQSRTRRSLAAQISPEMLALADHCRWIHVTDDSSSGERMVHLHPQEPDRFVASFVHEPRALEHHAQWRAMKPRSVCLAVRDTKEEVRCLRPTNLYWKR
jgi:LynF/TruF/PatF family peptide O-prenyltransferase